MIIQIKNLIPIPMVELDTRDSEIWETDSLSFPPGEKILLYAESGKGKTSLLSVIYGLRHDYKGEVYLDDKKLDHLSSFEVSDIRKNKISYIFQGLELFDELTAMENIQLKNRQLHYRTAQEITEIADTLEISAFLDKKAGLLSFGQRQRVAIIRAFCQPFEILLADEIFSHLDEKLTNQAYQLLGKELQKRNAGILFTSLEKTERSFFTKSYRV